jgi:cytochrome c
MFLISILKIDRGSQSATTLAMGSGFEEACRYAGTRDGTLAPRRRMRQCVGHRNVIRCPGVCTLKCLAVALSFSISCLLLIAARPPAAAAQGNPMRGKILFLRCASCHDVSTAPSAKIGPNLHGVIGRRVASLDGYKYSPALKSADFVWDAAHLDTWLTNPNAVAPGTAMAFAGIADAADRHAIISYLQTQGDAAAP